MKPIVVNNCNRAFRIDHAKIIQQILERIPDKFLVGLSEITLECGDTKYAHRMKYLLGKKGTPAKININIGVEDYSKYPFFSEFSLNVDLILKINEHVEQAIKPNTDDPDIVMGKKSGINYGWMYLGIWTPLLYPFNLLIYPIRKAEYLRNKIFRLSDTVINKTNKQDRE